MKKVILCLLGWCIFLQCSSDVKSKAKNNEESKPGISTQDIEKLAAEATNMDILFYNLNISLSQNDKNSLVQTAHFFAPVAKPTTMNCPSIGRIMMQNSGNIMLEADIHYSNTCQYFTILKNKVVIGTNAMTKEGVYFINQILSNYKPH